MLELLSDEDSNTIYIQIEEQYKKKKHLGEEFRLQILHSVCKMFDRIFICLDAIDELQTETQTDCLKSFQQIITKSCKHSTNTSGIFLFFTARPHVKDMITQSLGNYPRSVIIKANDDDIQKYILHQLDIDPHPKLMNNDLRQHLLKQVPKNSQGM